VPNLLLASESGSVVITLRRPLRRPNSVDSVPTTMLIDTGASFVTLSHQDAAASARPGQS
jgi:predicted aspartyl protease